MLKKITMAVRRQIDNAGIVDPMRDHECWPGTVKKLNRMLQKGELKITPVMGWGIMTHHCQVGGNDFHVVVEEVSA